MSDTTTEDPILAHLHERKASLEKVIADYTTRLDEVQRLLQQFADGRTRVRRRLRDAAPPGNGATAEQPQEGA